MSTARKLLLLAATVIAALALTTASATATDTPVEVENETNHCNPTCFIHVDGHSSLELHIGDHEETVSACNDEFEAEVNENGEGYIHVYENDAGPNPFCTQIKCNGDGEHPNETEWPFHITEEAGEASISVRFCLDAAANPPGTGRHCDVDIHIEDHGDHHYEFFADDEPCPEIAQGVNTEVNGEWESENPATTHDEFEIVH